MICPLIRVGCWSLPLLLYEVQCVLWALIKFLLGVWVPLHLEYRCLELRLLGRLLLWWIWNVLPYSFSKLLVERWFYSILEWLLQLAPWDHLLGKLFSSPLIWDSICLWHWGPFPVYSEMLGPVYVSSLLFYVFYCGTESIDIKRC